MLTQAGETLLHLDARHTDGEFAQRLLELRQDPTVQCERGQRALAILRFVGSLESSFGFALVVILTCEQTAPAR